MKIKILLFIGMFGAYTTFAMAADQDFIKEGSKRSIKLPVQKNPLVDGQGKEATSRYCGICHSLDYITTQPKFNKAKWQGEVSKMVKTYGAPISEDNAKIIADYITTYYGTGG